LSEERYEHFVETSQAQPQTEMYIRYLMGNSMTTGQPHIVTKAFILPNYITSSFYLSALRDILNLFCETHPFLP